MAISVLDRAREPRPAIMRLTGPAPIIIASSARDSEHNSYLAPPTGALGSLYNTIYDDSE